MEIRKPKFELGQKVVDKNGNVETVVGFNSYHFEDNEYWYDVSYDEGTHIKTESFLKPYVEKPKTVWDLQRGDKYYVTNDYMEVDNVTFDDDMDDSNYRKIGNCFLTKEEAEYELERRKIEAEMLRLGGRRTFKKGEDNYGIGYCEGLGITLYRYQFIQGLIYFDTLKETEDVIKTIGGSKIKKYIFGVE